MAQSRFNEHSIAANAATIRRYGARAQWPEEHVTACPISHLMLPGTTFVSMLPAVTRGGTDTCLHPQPHHPCWDNQAI